MTRFDDIQARHAAEHEEWRTQPTDLAGWANRAEAMWQQAGWLLDRVTRLETALKNAWLRCEHCKGLGRVPVALQGRPESSGMANCPRCKGDGYVRATLDTEQT